MSEIRISVFRNIKSVVEIRISGFSFYHFFVSLTAPIHLFTRYQLFFLFSCLAACYFFRLLFFPLFTLFFHYLLFHNFPLFFLFFSFKCFWYLNSIFPFLFALSFFIFCFLLFLLSSFLRFIPLKLPPLHFFPFI